MLDVVITRKHVEAQDICCVELQRADGGPLPAFSAGAHIDVHLGDGLIRQYSLCNSPHERHRYVLAVLRAVDSRGGSQAVHEQLAEGVALRISEPRNLFPLMPAAQHSLLFAGGIGITPIICMAEQLAGIGASFELHYCSRSRRHMAFLERLQQGPFAHCVHVYFDDEPGVQRLPTARLLAEPGAGRHLYVCGPGGFIAHVLDTAAEQRWSDETLHREYFAATPAVAAVNGNTRFDVHLARSGRTLHIPPTRSVAEVLLEAGVEVPLSCEQGICGTCLTSVLAGEPDHRDQFMTAAEHALNNQFTPCCSRSRSERLVLDL